MFCSVIYYPWCPLFLFHSLTIIDCTLEWCFHHFFFQQVKSISEFLTVYVKIGLLLFEHHFTFFKFNLLFITMSFNILWCALNPSQISLIWSRPQQIIQHKEACLVLAVCGDTSSFKKKKKYWKYCTGSNKTVPLTVTIHEVNEQMNANSKRWALHLGLALKSKTIFLSSGSRYAKSDPNTGTLQ